MQVSVPTTRTFKERLARLYQVYAPEKLAKIDEALFAFSGREDEMMKIATSKYGPEPSDSFYNLFLAAEQTASSIDEDATIREALGDKQRPFASKRRSFSERLMWLFLTHCPDKMLMIDDVLYAYRSNPEQMILDFVAEYGPEPEVDYRKYRLKRFYEYYCPEKVSSVDQILLAYAAEPEEKLYEDLKRKYGPEPSEYCAGTVAADKQLTTERERHDGSKSSSSTALDRQEAARNPDTTITTLSRDATMAFTKSRLLEFYNFYCPQKVPLVDDILATYTMHPRGIRQLFILLEEKYGPEPCKLRSTDAAADGSDSHSGTSGERQSDRYSMFSEATASLLAPRALPGTSPDESMPTAMPSKPEDLPRLADRLYRMMLFYDPSRLSDLYATMPFLTAEDAALQLQLWIQYFGSEPSEDALMDLQRLVVSKESADVAMRRLRDTPSVHQHMEEASASGTSNAGLERGTSSTFPPILSTASSLRLPNSPSIVLNASAAQRWQQQIDGADSDDASSSRAPFSSSSVRDTNTPPPPPLTVSAQPLASDATERPRTTDPPSLRTCTFPQRPLTPSVFPYLLYQCCVARDLTASFEVWYDSCDCTSLENSSSMTEQVGEAAAERGSTRWLVGLLLKTSSGGDGAASPLTFPWRKEPTLRAISLLPHAPLQQSWVPVPLRTQCFADVVAFVLPFYFRHLDAVMDLIRRGVASDGDPVASWEDTARTTLLAGTDSRLSVILGHCVKQVLCLPGHHSINDDDPSFLNHVMSVQLAGHALRYLICVTFLEALERRHRYPFQDTAVWAQAEEVEGNENGTNHGSQATQRNISTVVGQGNSILEVQDKEFREIRAMFVDGILSVIRDEHRQRMLHTEIVLRDGIGAEEEYQRSTILLEWGRVLFFASMPDGNPWRLNGDVAGGDGANIPQGTTWQKQHGLVRVVEQQWSVFTKPIYKPETARGASQAKAQLQSTAPKLRAAPHPHPHPTGWDPSSPTRSVKPIPSLTCLSPKSHQRPLRNASPPQSTPTTLTPIRKTASGSPLRDGVPHASVMSPSEDPRVVRYRAAKSQGHHGSRGSPQSSARRARQRAADEAISENPYQIVQFSRTLRQGDSVSPPRPRGLPDRSTTPRKIAKMFLNASNAVVTPRCTVPRGQFSMHSDFSIPRDVPVEAQTRAAEE